MPWKGSVSRELAAVTAGAEDVGARLQQLLERAERTAIERALERLDAQIEREGKVFGGAATAVLRRGRRMDEHVAELLVDHDVLRFLASRVLDAASGSVLLAARLQLLHETWDAHAGRLNAVIEERQARLSRPPKPASPRGRRR